MIVEATRAGGNDFDLVDHLSMEPSAKAINGDVVLQQNILPQYWSG